MARTNLNNMLSLLDPQLAYNWGVAIPRIPGIADSRQFTYRAISTSIPGTSIEAAQWEGHGMRLQSAGRRRYDDTWEVTLIETRDSATRDLLLAWKEFTRSWRNNSGAYKSEYAVPAELTMYDDKAVAVRGIKLINAWPSAIGQVQLSQSNEIVQYQVTFSFDLFEDFTPTE